MSVNFTMPAFVGHKLTAAGLIVKWTDEGREGVQETRDDRSVVLTTAAGTNIKFVKAIKRKWIIQWSMVPENQYQTIDGGWGRDELRNFVYSTNFGNPFYLIIDNTNNNANTQSVIGGIATTIETHFAYIDNFTETLELRRQNGNRYNLEIDLTEV